MRRLLVNLGLLACLLVFSASPVKADSNVALGKSYVSSIKPDSSYTDTNGMELTDGKYGPSGDPSNAAWQGRMAKSYTQTIDLGSNQSVNRISANFLKDPDWGINWPGAVVFSYSTNNRSFTSLGNAVPRSSRGDFKKYQWTGAAVTARYVCMKVTNSSWAFEDEMEVWATSGGVSAPSNLHYPQASISAMVGTSIATDTPTVNGAVTSWSVSPVLPAGLSLSNTNGAISGTPTVAKAQAAYTVTASNSAGSASTSVQISVNAQSSGGIPYPIHGVTVDDAWEGTTTQAQIVAALQAFSVKPTVRIVMDKGYPPSHYVSLFQAIHNVAYVMASPCDSYYMLSYTSVADYKKRFSDSVAALGPYVDLWEIANEINGEGPNAGEKDAWMGHGPAALQFNADKMYAAYTYIHGLGLKTVLTPYEFKPGDQSITMEAWMQKYVPADMKAGIDYVLVSYYEEDNDGYQPQWFSVFQNLQSIFPSSKLGIGECGNVAEDAPIDMVHHYYQMPKYVPNYVGGYFWWNFAEDCVPYSGNNVWSALNEDMIRQP